jgi:AraC-like DNA-binding protein
MHLLEIIAIIGTTQGLLLLMLVGIRFRGRHNLPLVILLVAFSVRLGTVPSWRPEALLVVPWLLPVAGATPLLFGPLVWWYVRELVLEDLRLPRFPAIHTAPWIIETCALTALIVNLDSAEWHSMVNDIFSRPVPWWMTGRNAIKVAFGLAYAVPSIRIAFGRASRASHVTQTRRLWARTVVALLFASLLSFVLVAVRPYVPAVTPDGVFARFYIPAVVMMATMYSLSWLVLIAPDVLTFGSRRYRAQSFSEIDSSEVQLTVDRVNRKMQSEIYRDPELTVTRLAKAVGVHPNRLSLVVNHVFGRNFSSLVNDYRLEYFIERVHMGDLEHFTISRLSIEAGFPSKSTFHRVFRDRFGTSPSAYLAEQRESREDGNQE